MAGTLVDYRKSSIGAEETLYFLDTAQTATVTAGAVADGEFHMMYLMADASSVASDKSLETIADVTQKIQPQEITAGSKTMEINQLFLTQDPVCKIFDKLFRENTVGEKSHFYMIEVDTWDTNKAYIRDVVVNITGITNEAGDKRRVTGSIAFTSEDIAVTSTVSIDDATGVLSFS